MQITIPFTAAGESVRVVELMVKPGDPVSKGEVLFAVENDKSVFDVPSTRSGVISSMSFKRGDIVENGTGLVIYSDEALDSASDGDSSSSDILVRSPYLQDNQVLTLVEQVISKGEFIEAKEVIAAIQSETAVVDVSSPVGGVLIGFYKSVGETMAHAQPLARVRPMTFEKYLRQDNNYSESPQATSGEPAGAIAQCPSPPLKVLSANTGGLAGPAGMHLTPSQRARLRREGVASSSGSADTSSSVAPTSSSPFSLLPWPKIDFSKFGPVEPKPLSRIKKISGANLHRNWVMVPHVTNNDEADITELDELRVKLNKEHEKAGVKFTMLAFVIKAVVSALQKFPDFNASLDGDNLVLKQYYHIGFAADTPNGLVVPVIRDADKKGLVDIAKEMAELSKLARDGKLKPDQMQGGCFSISSLGGIGGTHFTPIINAPEVAILGLSRGYQKPVWDGKQFVPRLTLPMSLSYDHRVIDGAAAARFNAYLSAILGDFRRVIL
jgi:pyruvate dehydrogenase E2 component (dihydrolipoamide acetyltransferase)